MSSPALHVVLIGPMAVGKTSIGRVVAEHLQRPFLDSDAWIEARLGMSGRAFADTQGLDSLHELELSVFLEMAASPEPSVIAPAESVVDTEDGRGTLLDLFTVSLTADPKTLLARRNPDDHRRRMSPEELQLRSASRATHLSACSEMVVRTDRTSETQAANDIVEAFNSGRVRDPRV
ncbi:MAG: shikimate kinase [Acidimicrobiia bacterium]